MRHIIYFVVIYHTVCVNIAALQHMESKAKVISLSTQYFGFV